MPPVPPLVISRVAADIKHRVRVLRMEVRTRSRALRISALIGVYTFASGVGRRTLGCRLAHMNRKTIKRVPEIDFFTGSYIGRFKNPFNRGNPFNRIKFILTLYCYPFKTPDIEIGPDGYYDFFYEQRHFERACCIIFLFDILCRDEFIPTLDGCKNKIYYGLHVGHFPEYLLVGNKYDKRRKFKEEILTEEEKNKYPGPVDLPPDDNPDLQLLDEIVFEFNECREVNFSEDSDSADDEPNSADDEPNPKPILIPFDTMQRMADDSGLDYLEVSAKYKYKMGQLFRNVLLAAYKHSVEEWYRNHFIQ